MTNPPVPATPLDVEAPGPPKLESRADLHRTATQPEKEGLAVGSGTSLDVEACVRLLERLADAAAGRSAADVDYAERHERTHPSVATDHYLGAARFAAEATLLRALASALPGMGKDSERLDWLESFDAVTITEGADGHEVAVMRLGVPIAIGATLRGAIDRGFTLKPLRSAARAAQPEETSADDK